MMRVLESQIFFDHIALLPVLKIAGLWFNAREYKLYSYI